MRIRYIFTIVASSLLLVCGSCSTGHRRAERSEALAAYYDAAERYQKLYRRTKPSLRPLRAHYAYRTAECYRRLRHLSRALYYYQQAERYGSTETALYYRLGYCLQASGRYAEARTYYQRSLTRAGYAEQARWVLRGLDSLASLPSDSSYHIHLLTALQSTASDYAPAIHPSGTSLLFTSRRGRTKRLDRTGEAPERLYQVLRTPEGKWGGHADTLGFYSDKDMGYEGGTFALNGQRYYLRQLGAKGSRLVSLSRLSVGGWGQVQSLDVEGLLPVDARHPSINASGTRLYFTARTDSLSGDDLYYIELTKGHSQRPIRLPQEINTLGDEAFPYALGDSCLYFASDGHWGLGGYDLYKAILKPDNRWQVEHLPAPLNSPADEWSIAPDLHQSHSSSLRVDYRSRGIIASSRGDSRGRPHLYEYRQMANEVLIDGLVLDREDYGLAGAMVRIVSRYGDEGERSLTTRSDGAFQCPIEPNNEYILHVSKEGYLSQYAELRVLPQDSLATFQIDFRLAKRSVPEVLRQLHYAFDSDEILPVSQGALQELLRILRHSPEVRIAITAHSDRMGSAEYNRRLSWRRAERVRSYLIEQGIAPERLEARGAGMNEPYIVSRRTAEQYSFLSEGQILSRDFIATLPQKEQAIADSLNRRTDFRTL